MEIEELKEEIWYDALENISHNQSVINNSKEKKAQEDIIEFDKQSSNTIQCPYCDYTFEHINTCMNRTVTALHLKYKHPKKKKEFFRKLKRKELAKGNTQQNPKSKIRV